MAEQVIIAISREYGSGGHEIGRKLAAELGLKFYDRNMLDEIAKEKNIQIEYLEKYDEKPKKLLFSRRVGEHSNSYEEIVAEMQFEYLQNKAESGESFVIVGRCAETVLQEFKGLISIFVLGDESVKIKRIMEHFSINEADAVLKEKRHDKYRKRYHNRHSEHKWGDSRYYDVCINSSRLGIEGTVEILKDYIERRMDCMHVK